MVHQRSSPPMVHQRSSPPMVHQRNSLWIDPHGRLTATG
jgi:hypothetical protein